MTPGGGRQSGAAAEAAIVRAAGLARAGHLREAIDLLQRDAAAMNHPAGCNVLGMMLLQAGAAAPALGCFDRAVALAPGFADAHSNRGVVLQQLGRLDEALAAFQAALRAEPRHLNALVNSGNVLKLLDRDEEALTAFDRAVGIKPDLAEAVLKRAHVHVALQDHAAALADFGRALSLEPANGEAALGRVSALVSLKRFAEALAGIDRILAARPGDVHAAVARGQVLTELDRPAEALDLADGLTRRGLGGSKAEIVRAVALWRLGRRGEAIAAAEDAARRHPGDVQIRQALSQYYLATGEFARGWAAYEFRAGALDRRMDRIEARAPRWAGEPLAGKTILAVAEQGIGDTVQFVRFLGDLVARGATVKALVQPVLMRLMRSYPAPVAWFDAASAVGAFDFQVRLLSLPHGLGIGPDDVARPVPYLTPEAETVAAWRSRLGDTGFPIGVVWQGNPRFGQDHRRSVPLRHFAPLARVKGARLISLQAVHGLDQLDHLPHGMTVETLGDKVTANPDGVSEIAAAMMALDLIVTSDTAMAHLAGALGVRVWVALNDDPDWRWLFDRADSPWYPTMRLFRQKARGDWDGVFGEMAEALGERIRRRGDAGETA